MARTSLPIYFQITSCTRSAILNTVMFHWDWFGFLTLTSKWVSPKKLFFHDFLPAMASDHTSMKYYCNRAYSKNHCVHNLLALWSSAQTCWQWARPKLHSLLSAHHLIDECFLTTKNDKRMHLLTRLYGIITPVGLVSLAVQTNQTNYPWTCHWKLTVSVKFYVRGGWG